MIILAQEPPAPIRSASFSYLIERPYQTVQHQLFKLKAYNEISNKQRISFTLSSQYNIRKEYDIVRSETASPQLELDLLTKYG